MSVVKLHVFMLVCGVLWVQLGLRYTHFYTILERLMDYKGNHAFIQQDSASAHTVKNSTLFSIRSLFLSSDAI